MNIPSNLLEISTDLPRHYKYSMKVFKPFANWRVEYIIIGVYGAAQLHVTKYDYSGQIDYVGGVEYHSRTPTSNSPPSHYNCEHAGGICWHDGSSLAAEDFIDLVKFGAHAAVFRKLIEYADDYFSRYFKPITPICEAISTEPPEGSSNDTV